jgi:hypothetical protein
MRNFQIVILLILVTTSSEGQTLAKWWHGKHKEKLLVTPDSSAAEFSPFGIASKSYDVKVTGDSIFSLGLVSWKSESLPDSNHGYDRQRTERLVDWFSFKILKLNADTLIIKYSSTKRLDDNHFGNFTLSNEVFHNSLILYSSQKIQQIRNPVFISLSYDRGGYHVQIDSSGVVKYWFDEANSAQVPPGKIVQGKLTNIQLNELKYLFRHEEIQELPENFGNARDGRHTVLTIKALPRDIISYGSGGGDPDTVRWKLFRFLGNINEKLSTPGK